METLLTEQNQTQFRIQINHFMPCVTPQTLELAQQSYNHINEQIK